MPSPGQRIKESLWPLGGTILGVFVMPIAIAQYPEFFNENRWLLPVSVIVVILCWSVPLLIHENARKLFVWSCKTIGIVATVIVIIVAGGIVLCLGHGLVRFHVSHLNASLHPKSAQQKQQTSPKPKDHPPATLEDTFRQDFPYLFKAAFYDITWISRRDGTKLRIESQVYMDFQANTVFVGFYIPSAIASRFNDDDYRACLSLANLAETPISDFARYHEEEAGPPGQMTNFGDLRFSGRVVLYTGDDLSITQQAEVVKVYKAKNLSVTLEGPDHLRERQVAWYQQHPTSH